MKLKTVLIGAGIVVLGALAAVLAVDYYQRQPFGARLAPVASFRMPDTAFMLRAPQLVPTEKGRLLTGTLFRARQGEPLQLLPGETLDNQLPGPASEMRMRNDEAAARRANENWAATMKNLGHPGLASMSLNTPPPPRNSKRQFVATLESEGLVRINATLPWDGQHFFTLPGGKILLDSGVTLGGQRSAFHLAFVSDDGGRTWSVDGKQVPDSSRFNGFVSESDGFLVEQERNTLWVTRDTGKTWATFDMASAVWGDIPEQDRGSIAWMVLPASPEMAVGWSGRWDRLPSETRRFKVHFETGKPVDIRQVERVSDINVGHWNPSPKLMSRAPDGGVVGSVYDGLRYLDPSTWRWSELIEIPSMRGMKTSLGNVWTADGIWIVKVSGKSILDQLLYPRCVVVSATNYFYSRDQGKSWVPFTFAEREGSPSFGCPSPSSCFTVLGWDASTNKLMVFDPQFDSSGSGEFKLYDLPKSE